MKTAIGLIFAFCFLSLSANLYAQESKSPGNTGTRVNQQHSDSATQSQQHQETGKNAGWDHPEKVIADFEDFPNLHPLFVHIPVMLLPFAAFFQLLTFFVFKREFSWVVMILVLVGFVGGYIAASVVHPDVGNLPEHAQKVYDKHDMYATWTLWLSGTAVLLKMGSHFLLRRKVWAEGVVALVLFGATYTVSMAGHLGTQLVYIEGVGPQGQYMGGQGHSDGKHSH